MNFANMIVIVFMTYYSIYLIQILFNKNLRNGIKQKNSKLANFRNIKLKSLEDQKKFLDLKYPKTGPFKFKITKKGFINFLLYIFSFSLIMKSYFWLFIFFNLNFEIWQGILFIIIAPILFNFVLKKFNLHKEDISIYFK